MRKKVIKVFVAKRWEDKQHYIRNTICSAYSFSIIIADYSVGYCLDHTNSKLTKLKPAIEITGTE